MGRRSGGNQLVLVFAVGFLIIFGMLVATGKFDKLLNIGDSGDSGVTVNERYVSVQFLVQRDLTTTAVSGASIYIWTDSSFSGDYVDSLSTDSSGQATSQERFLTGSTIYIYVEASGYYPFAGVVHIPSASQLASEETVVKVSTIKLKYISTTVSLSGSTVGNVAFTNDGSGSYTDALEMSIKVSGLVDNSYYGADYIDYVSAQKDKYIGPILIIKLNSSLISPIQGTYISFVEISGVYYYVFKLSQVVNDGNDPLDGTALFTIQWDIIGSGNVNINAYLLDAVLESSISIPNTLTSLADASLTNFTATVTP